MHGAFLRKEASDTLPLLIVEFIPSHSQVCNVQKQRFPPKKAWCIFIRHYLGTLLNSQMEIQVVNSIFKAINDETIVEIKNADVATLNKIHSNPSSINSLNGVHVHSSNPSDECRMNRYTTSTMWYEGNNKRFFCELSINNFSGIHVAAATTRSEKKKGKPGRHYWVPYKTSISAQVYGSAVNNSCLQSATFSEYDSKNDGSYVRTAEYFNYTVKTKKDAIHSIHTCNGQTVSLTLSW